MKYISTQKKSPAVDLRTALFSSLPDDQGLYLPESLPTLSPELLGNLASCSFAEVAFEIVKLMLGDDIADDVLQHIVKQAFNFPIKIEPIKTDVYCLELFHGPTFAFKDFAARFMAQLMAYYVKDDNKLLTILVATSGDTGGAVADAFHEVDNINVVILYPYGRVSALQEAQLNSYKGNVQAIAVNGTFDDCQALVKQAFRDKINTNLASANSINIARLIPQMLYYVYASLQLKKNNKPLVISVPSGNFGNLTAAVMAKKIGAPIDHFIAACNTNDTVPRYLETGHYKPHKTQHTLANAMDVSDPSNFQRLTYLYQNNIDHLRHDVTALSFDDEQIRGMTQKCFDEHHYILDPHTAIAYLALESFDLKNSQGLFVATAHPAKFIDTFDKALQKHIQLPAPLKNLLSLQLEPVYIKNDYSSLQKLL